MTKKRHYLLCVALLLIASPNFGQMVASARSAHAAVPATKKLRDVLIDFMKYYQVEILFFEKFVDGYAVPTDFIQWDASIEKNLETVLNSTPLSFKKEETGFIVIPKENNTPETVLALEITGTVTDSNGAPVPSVTIIEKDNPSNGTVSDVKGNFSLRVQDENAVLVFSSVGFKTKEITVGKQTTLEVKLEEDNKALNEVVIVTGYVNQRRADITSAVSSLSALNTTVMPLSNVEQALQGRVGGVQVTTSGQPGATNNVRIRGYGSLTNNNPLYIVDGVPTYDISNLNPYDIETTTVLKDAAAATIYGARAASGVIVYTTKHGSYDGKFHASLDVGSGITLPGNGLPTLGSTAQAQKDYEALRNSGVTSPEKLNNVFGTDINNPIIPDYINVGVNNGTGIWTATGNIMEGDPRITLALANYNINPNNGPIVQVVKANKTGTDWYKAVTQTAQLERYSLGFSGGNERAHFYANLSYYNQQGILLNTYLQRYNFRINSEFKPSKYVRVGENLQIVDRQNILGTDQQTITRFAQIFQASPISPVYDVNGGYASNRTPNIQALNGVANYQRLTKDNNLNETYSGFGNVYIEVDPLKDLMLRSSFGGYLAFGNSYQNQLATYENSNITPNTISNSYNYSSNWVLTNTARYAKKMDKHSLGVLVGQELVKSPARSTSLSSTATSPFSSDHNYASIATGSNQTTTSTAAQIATLSSLFGSVNYNYDARYYLNATVRRDASSVFGVNNRAGVFPAFSAAWRLTSEKFMGNVSWLDELKLRGGWGIMGNQNINPTNQFALYQTAPVNGYDMNGTNNSVTSGVTQNQPGNPNGQWERNITTNIGLDVTLLKGSLDIIIDVWQKKTDGLLFQPNILSVAGVFPTNPYINIAAMTNSGIDLQIVKRITISNDFKITLDGNISPFKNTITALAPGVNYFDTKINNVAFMVSRNAVGQPISSFYGYKVIGYFNSTDEVNSSPTQDGAGVGRFKYADTHPDGTIDDKDRVFLGSPLPKFIYGLNANITYKSFGLNLFFYGKYGNKILNYLKHDRNFYTVAQGALSPDVLSSWTPALGNSAKTPIFENAGNFSTSGTMNSWYLENGSYLRLRNVMVSYKLPLHTMSKYGLKSAQVYIQANNLFTITKYTGKDPEIGSPNDQAMGFDRGGNYPITRVYSLGVNIGF